MNNNESMKAASCIKYGSGDAIILIDTQKPVPKDDEVLVRVHASSINSYDWRLTLGKPFPVRLREGLFKPRNNKILGADIAGVVEAIGKGVTRFAVGDRVYGCMADSSGDGGFAEYKCAKEGVIATIPTGVTFEQAAAVPMAAVTALQGLRDFGGIQEGQSVLINGASGGVGTFAVQIAKCFGAEVTGVCAARYAETARSIGADHLIDYAKEDFTKNTKKYDLILDIAANHTLSECRSALKPGGTCAVVGFSSFGLILQIMLFGKKTIKMVMANNTRGSDLAFLNPLLESGRVAPVIDGRYKLADIREAFEYFANGRPKGKVVISIK